MNVQTSRMHGLSAANRLPAFPGRAVRGCAVLLSVLCFVSVMRVAPACADEYAIIIEKNLFHDQRQKWEMEKSPSKGAAAQAGSAEAKNIEQINLFGTVIRDSHSYAVMRVTQPPAPRAVQRGRPPRGTQPAEQSQEGKRPYAVGDFISGFRLVEIRPGSVLLQDPADNNRYEVFMNQGETERSAVRTEIVEDKPQPAPTPAAPASARRPASRPQPAPEESPNPAQAADFMRQRFQSNMQMLRDDPNDTALQQAERDWEKLQPMMPALEESGREDLMRLREEFEKMRQR
ncbi:MAG: hypothetical protein FJ119_04870 [Deltaproteobacteria bacterium]|nr:hypothetical protein [Deltaproteobacteria bacterium]